MIKKIYTIQEIQDKLTPIFEARNINKAILFGSYAKGTAKAVSDVDIMIDGDVRGFAFFGIWEEIAQALKKEVDLIALYSIKPGTRIYDEIHDTGVVLYEKEQLHVMPQNIQGSIGAV